MKRLPRFVNQEEFEKLFIAAGKIPHHKKQVQLAILLGFEAGMRISEILGLRGEGKNGYKIQPLTSDKVEDAFIRIDEGKGKKDRIVPRPKRMNENAKNMLPLQLSRRTLQSIITRLGKTILDKKISFHSLRHGFGSHLAGQGRPLHEIQMLMGHSRMDTTGIYLHANPVQAIQGAKDAF